MKYTIKKYLVTMASNGEIGCKHKEYRRGRVYNIDGVEIGGISQKGYGIILTHVASGLAIPVGAFAFGTYEDFENNIDDFKLFLKEHAETLKKATEALKDLPIYEG